MGRRSVFHRRQWLLQATAALLGRGSAARRPPTRASTWSSRRERRRRRGRAGRAERAGSLAAPAPSFRSSSPQPRYPCLPRPPLSRFTALTVGVRLLFASPASQARQPDSQGRSGRLRPPTGRRSRAHRLGARLRTRIPAGIRVHASTGVWGRAGAWGGRESDRREMLSRWHARAALGFCAQKYYNPPYLSPPRTLQSHSVRPPVAKTSISAFWVV